MEVQLSHEGALIDREMGASSPSLPSSSPSLPRSEIGSPAASSPTPSTPLDFAARARSSSVSGQASRKFIYTLMLDNPKHPYFYSVALEGVSLAGKCLPATRDLRRIVEEGNDRHNIHHPPSGNVSSSFVGVESLPLLLRLHWSRVATAIAGLIVATSYQQKGLAATAFLLLVRQNS
ncbi:hypothetical protein MRB53_028819 [Persea americana]|uniref:Uncharacterized protein n=1 Tax=Persea americana TaxID=3435 RepID=A0ACC2KH48_PERAE|nr:hypothetical protein MRB53_028819 [Persea americana]